MLGHAQKRRGKMVGPQRLTRKTFWITRSRTIISRHSCASHQAQQPIRRHRAASPLAPACTAPRTSANQHSPRCSLVPFLFPFASGWWPPLFFLTGRYAGKTGPVRTVLHVSTVFRGFLCAAAVESHHRRLPLGAGTDGIHGHVALGMTLHVEVVCSTAVEG